MEHDEGRGGRTHPRKDDENCEDAAEDGVRARPDRVPADGLLENREKLARGQRSSIAIFDFLALPLSKRSP
jgi:hypothetical protein